MANYKCKMCGAPLEVNEGQTVAVCSFCGSKQTVANADDERKENLYNRANALRANCEFDKAILAYQSILSIFPDEPEAHWGLCLCKYGIEYIDDQVTKTKKPTIHRMSFESILKDSDYITALAQADVIAKEDSLVIFIDTAYIYSNANINSSIFSQFLINLLEITQKKLSINNERVDILTNKTIRNKLLSYFKHSYMDTNARIVYIPSTFTALADYLAIDRSAMSRELKNLKDEGLIEIKNKKIKLLYFPEQ